MAGAAAGWLKRLGTMTLSCLEPKVHMRREDFVRPRETFVRFIGSDRLPWTRGTGRLASGTGIGGILPRQREHTVPGPEGKGDAKDRAIGASPRKSLSDPNI